MRLATSREESGSGEVPQFSVVVPAYNAERTILRALRSIGNQDHPAREIILVDDGSTDHTAEIAAATGLATLRIVRTSNGGASRARNEGIRRATGDWVAFLDADDLWRVDHLSSLAAAIRRFPEVSFVGSRGPRRARGSELPRKHARFARFAGSRPKKASYFALARRHYFRRAVDMSSVAVRRRLLLDASISFPMDRVGEDMAFFCAVSAHTELGWIRRETTVTTSTPGSVMDSLVHDPQNPDCGRVFSFPHYVAAGEVAADASIPRVRRSEAARFRDNLITRYWPTILVHNHQGCAEAFVPSLQGNWTPSAILFRLAASVPAHLGGVLGKALGVVMRRVGVSTDSPFSRQT